MSIKTCLKSLITGAATLSVLGACAHDPASHRTNDQAAVAQFSALIESQPSAAGFTTLFATGDVAKITTESPRALRSRTTNLDAIAINQITSGAKAGKESFLGLNLFADTNLIVRQTDARQTTPTRFSWTGVALNDPMSLVNLVVDSGQLTGTAMSQGRVYEISPLANGTHQITEIKVAALPDELPPLSAGTSTNVVAHTGGNDSAVDVLVVYTSDAAKKFPDIGQRIQVAIDQSNASFRNSGVNARLVLAGTREVNYRESGDAKVDLENLASGSDKALQTIARMRDQLNADVVSLWTADAGASCGAAFGLGKQGTSFADYAFNTVAANCATATLSFTNVVGRNLGLGMDGSGQGGAFDFSRGFVDNKSGWRTLDSSNASCNDTGSYCYRLPILSGGKRGSDNANNSRTLNETFNLVANFRTRKQPAATITNSTGNSELFADQLSDSDQRELQSVAYKSPTQAFVKRSRLVSLNAINLPNAVPKAGDNREIALTLFPGMPIVAKQMNMEFRSDTMASWSGNIEGVENGKLLLVLSGDQVTGLATTPKGIFRIRPTGKGHAHEIAEIDQSKFPKDHPDKAPAASADAATGSTGSTGTTTTTTTPDGTGPLIDVLVIYTPQSDSPTVASDIQLAVDVTNSAYAASGVNQRIRLVKAIKSSNAYVESADMGIELQRLKTPGDSQLDEVAALRDQYGADTVVEWSRSDNYCGLAYLNTDPANFASLAYAVVNKDCASSNFSFPHELGHNMGINHDMYVSGAEPSSYPYSHGYVNKAGSWRTIMAYNNACADAGIYCTRIGQFSNPNKTYNGAAMGDSSANAAMALNNTAALVSAYRPNMMSQYASMFVTGTFNNWTTSGAVGTMSWKGQGNWETQITLPVGSTNYYFMANSSQATVWGDNDEPNAIPQSGVAGASQGNILVNITQAGNYTLKFNENSLAYSLALTPPSTIKRTVVYMYGITQPGQDMYMRGGIDKTYAKNNLGKDCTPTNWLCAIPITHNLRATDAKRAYDKYLDWYGAEAGQGTVEGSPLIWTTNVWPAGWGPKKTLAVDGVGEDPENKFGDHYWKLDIQMDCSKTVNGWFELKSYISNGSGWENNISQPGAPYASANHFAKCGSMSIFRRNEATATFKSL